MKNKKYILLIGIVGIVVIISLFLTFLETKNGTDNKNITLPTPIPIPSKIPGVQYKKGSIDKTVEKINAKTPLPENEQTIKERLKKEKGILYTTNNITIYYGDILEAFRVEINTPDITQAKTEALTWFQQQGFSPTGICSLPVTFFLSTQAKVALQETQTIFNPLPDNCQ